MAWEMSHKLFMEYQIHGFNPYTYSKQIPEYFLFKKLSIKYPKIDIISKDYIDYWKTNNKHKAMRLVSAYDFVNDCPTNEFLILLATEKI